MGSDTQAKFGFTTFITLDNVESSGVYGQVSPLSTLGANPPGVYGQVSALPTSNAELPGVYGQVSALSTFGAQPLIVYGQVTPTVLFGVDPGVVYGQVVALSGFGPITLATNIQGVGDIIYYGDTADLNVEGGEFFATFDNQVEMSGMAAPIATYDSLSTNDSNSIVFSTSGVSILPAVEVGVYLYFSNHNGLALSVSGADPIVSAGGTSNLVSVSGVGSHLGLVGADSKWIAIEENGVI